MEAAEDPLSLEVPNEDDNEQKSNRTEMYNEEDLKVEAMLIGTEEVKCEWGLENQIPRTEEVDCIIGI